MALHQIGNFDTRNRYTIRGKGISKKVLLTIGRGRIRSQAKKSLPLDASTRLEVASAFAAYIAEVDRSFPTYDRDTFNYMQA